MYACACFLVPLRFTQMRAHNYYVCVRTPAYDACLCIWTCACAFKWFGGVCALVSVCVGVCADGRLISQSLLPSGLRFHSALPAPLPPSVPSPPPPFSSLSSSLSSALNLTAPPLPLTPARTHPILRQSFASALLPSLSPARPSLPPPISRCSSCSTT